MLTCLEVYRLCRHIDDLLCLAFEQPPHARGSILYAAACCIEEAARRGVWASRLDPLRAYLGRLSEETTAMGRAA